MATFLSDNFRAQNITRDEEGSFLALKVPINQEDITVPTVSIPDNSFRIQKRKSLKEKQIKPQFRRRHSTQ